MNIVFFSEVLPRTDGPCPSLPAAEPVSDDARRGGGAVPAVAAGARAAAGLGHAHAVLDLRGDPRQEEEGGEVIQVGLEFSERRAGG